MSDADRYAVDDARVVSEVIDGEAVVVNLANGYYYSLDRPAAEIWGWLQDGRSLAEILAAIRDRYDCSGADAETAVRSLIASFVADDLVSRRPPGDPPEPAREPGASAERKPFRAPSFQRFEDMQGFLLVDPIHEVDDTGWPHIKPTASRE